MNNSYLFKLFISYSHHDLAYKETLKDHLMPLVRKGLIKIWEDTHLLPGEEWHERIGKQLDDSDIIIMLVSAKFFASDYISQHEIPQSLKLHESGLSMVIPIIATPCHWINSNIAHLMALPGGNQSVGHPENHQIWSEIVEKIEISIIKKLTEDREIGFLPSTPLAIGFFENMARLVVENLIRMRNGIPITADQKPSPLELGPPVRLEFPLQRSEILFKMVIPDKLIHASYQAYQACVNHYGLIRVAVPTPTRVITVFCHPEVLEPNGRLIIYDIPSTLFSSWNAIDLFTVEEYIRQLLSEKEKRNFKKTINYLLNKYKDKLELSGIDQMVKMITIGEMSADFPEIEPFVMKD